MRRTLSVVVLCALSVVVGIGAVTLHWAGPAGAVTPMASTSPSPAPTTLAQLSAAVVALQKQVATLQSQLSAAKSVLAMAPYVSVTSSTMNGVVGPNVVFKGCNLHVMSKTSETDATHTGNLIVGWDTAPSPAPSPLRSGSNDLVCGNQNNWTSYGEFVAGQQNTVSGVGCTVSGGFGNLASGSDSSVSAGELNRATIGLSSVTGGEANNATNWGASVSGGGGNAATGEDSSICGGGANIASALSSTVTGGHANTASSDCASISGGDSNTASGEFASVSGGENNMADLMYACVSGGYGNQAYGEYAQRERRQGPHGDRSVRLDGRGLPHAVTPLEELSVKSARQREVVPTQPGEGERCLC